MHQGPRWNLGSLLPFLVCLALMAVRSWPRWQHPELWAEDGDLFLPEALRLGLGSLSIPYGGYYHTVQRSILVGLAALFPIGWLPSGIHLSCVLIYAHTITKWVQPEFAWLVPSRTLRWCISVLLALTPGLTEITGNLCNLNWVLFFWLAFEGLKEPDYRYRPWELAIAALVVTSIGTGILLVPLFLWRVVVVGCLRIGKAQLLGNSIVLGLLVLWTGWLIVALEPNLAKVPEESGLTMAETFVSTTYDNFVFRPWFGDTLASALVDRTLFLAWAVKLAALACFVHVLRTRWRQASTQALLIFAAAVVVWPILSWIARPGNMWAFQVHLSPWFLQHRYSFPVGVAATICWLGLLQPMPPFAGWRTGLCVLFVGVGLFGGTARFWIPPYGSERRWEQLAPVLERFLDTGCPQFIDAPIYPDGWKFHYDAARRDVNCAP